MAPLFKLNIENKLLMPCGGEKKKLLCLLVVDFCAETDEHSNDYSSNYLFISAMGLLKYMAAC